MKAVKHFEIFVTLNILKTLWKHLRGFYFFRYSAGNSVIHLDNKPLPICACVEKKKELLIMNWKSCCTNKHELENLRAKHWTIPRHFVVNHNVLAWEQTLLVKSTRFRKTKREVILIHDFLSVRMPRFWLRHHLSSERQLSSCSPVGSMAHPPSVSEIPGFPQPGMDGEHSACASPQDKLCCLLCWTFISETRCLVSL